MKIIIKGNKAYYKLSKKDQEVLGCISDKKTRGLAIHVMLGRAETIYEDIEIIERLERGL